jgi:succinyl-diaminopimelate desuccinylase
VLSELNEQFLVFERLVLESRDEMVENLCRLLEFSTVSGSQDPEEARVSSNEFSRAFSFLNGLARQMGFAWRNYNNKICVIEQPGGTEVIGLPLHIDVVPSGEGWHYPAFGGMVENGVIYGRGAQDDKGPIIEMLYALHGLKRLNLPFRRTVRLIIASQEETGDWSDVESYLAKEPAPDFCIVSDADFPIVSGEKGMVDLKIEIRWPKEIEDYSALQFRSFVGGERPNVVPNRAEITWLVVGGQAAGVTATLKHFLGEYLQANPEADAFPMRIDTDPESGLRQVHFTFLGKSAHGSRPFDGHNAVLDALGFFANVPELPQPLVRTAKFLLESCKDIYGGGLGIAREHDFLGKTTSSLDILRIDAKSAAAIINIRPTLGVTSGQALETVRQRVSDWAKQNALQADVQFSGKPHEPLYVDPEKHPELIGALQEAYTRVTGKQARLIAKGGTTFAKAFPNAVSFGPVNPPEEKDLAHQADECVPIDALIRNAKIYGFVLLLLATDYKSAIRRTSRGLGIGP